MILDNPVAGVIRPDARYYPDAPGAVHRTRGSRQALVTQDYGPTTVDQEPPFTAPAGESDIYGNPIPAGRHPKFHKALDISTGGSGTSVVAAAAGKVIESGPNASKAEIVGIDHGGGFVTRYVHLASRLVTVGQRLVAGQKLGTIGSTGISTAAHLHFMVEKDGVPVDPWRRLAQNTGLIDPDAEEPPMPVPSTYIPGYRAAIGAKLRGVNVRAGASTAAKVIRQIAAGVSEAWIVTGWETGEIVGGSGQWLFRWGGQAWEYVHASGVAAGPTAPVVDCAPAATAARKAGIADAAAAAGAVK